MALFVAGSMLIGAAIRLPVGRGSVPPPTMVAASPDAKAEAINSFVRSAKRPPYTKCTAESAAYWHGHVYMCVCDRTER